MDNKTQLKKVLQESKKGNIDVVLHLIKTNNVQLPENYALNIVVDCSTKCSNCPSQEEVSSQDVTDLLNIAVKKITNPKESYSLAYLQSVFYVLKFFISREHYVQIGQIIDVITPRFLQKTLPDDHKKVFSAITNQFMHMISNLKCTEETNVLEILRTVTEIAIRISEPGEIFKLMYSCVFKINNMQFKVKCQTEYYSYALQLMLIDEREKLVCSKDYCSSFLTLFAYIWSNILKTNDLKEFKKFHNYSLSFFKNVPDILKLLKTLEFVLYFLPKEFNISKYEEKIWKGFLKSNQMQVQIMSMFYCLLYSLASYYKTTEKSWLEFSEEEQLKHFDKLKKISETFSKPFKCACCSPDVKTCFESQRFFELIYTLSKIQLKTGNASHNYCRAVRKMFESFYESSKSIGEPTCKNWQQVWKNLNVHVYNLAVTLYKTDQSECVEYFIVFVRYSLKLNIENDDKMLTTALNSICDKIFKENNYRRCMVLTAFLVLILKDNRTRSTALKYWWLMSKVKLKETSKKEEDQHLTLVSALEKNKSLIEPMADASTFLTTPVKIELLTLELEVYKSRWCSREPMLAAFKELSTVADLSTIVEVAVSIFGDCQQNTHVDVLKIIMKTLETYKEQLRGPNEVQKFYLGVLHHLKYKYVTTNVMEKHCDEMEKSLMVAVENTESSDPPDALPKEEKDEYGNISSYDSLKLDKFLVTMKILNISVEMFESTNFEALDERQCIILSTLLLKIGFEYKLQKITKQSLKCFELALKLAELKNNSLDILGNISFIIENNNISRDVQEKYIIQGDKIVNNLEHSAENLKTILKFLITKSKVLLYVNHKKSYEAFKRAEELYEKEASKEKFPLFKAKLLHMRHKFLNDLPCDLQMENHRILSLSYIIEAHTMFFKELSKLEFSDTQTLSTIFDVNEEIVKLHYNLRLPREVRYYSHQTMFLAQKMVIPLRTVTYLCYRAQADLISCRFDDCKLRLEGIDDILCSRKTNYTSVAKSCVPDDGGCGDVQTITNSMQEIVLDLPTSYRKQFSYASPTLIIESFKMPSFLSHAENCGCFFCGCTEYHGFLLFKTKLDALYHDYQKSPDIAADFFKGALALKEALLTFYNDKLEEEKITEVCCEILLEHSNHLTRCSAKAEAVKTNSKLLEILENKQAEYSYIYCEALLQNICLNFERPEETKADDELSIIESSQLSRTPESKRSKVTVKVTSGYKYSPPKRRVKKPRKINLSPDESDQKPPVQKVGISSGCLLPSKLYANTPGPSTSELRSSNEIETPNLRKTPRSVRVKDDCDSPEFPISKIQIFSGSGVKKRAAAKSTKKQPVIYGTNFVLPSTSKSEKDSTGSIKKQLLSLTESLNKNEDSKRKTVKKNLMKAMREK